MRRFAAVIGLLALAPTITPSGLDSTSWALECCNGSCALQQSAGGLRGAALSLPLLDLVHCKSIAICSGHVLSSQANVRRMWTFTVGGARGSRKWVYILTFGFLQVGGARLYQTFRQKKRLKTGPL